MLCKNQNQVQGLCSTAKKTLECSFARYHGSSASR
jgi:hypothetical protein